MTEKNALKTARYKIISKLASRISTRVLLKKPKTMLLIGLILGAILVLGIRFVTYAPPQHTHYHANFAVYINGVQEQFKDKQYYEDVAICSTTTDISFPQQRVHMHDGINSVVHVHDHATTWGQFFENIGWYVGPDFIQNKAGQMYKADSTAKLHIVINGQDYTDLTPITNQVIGDRDRLLVSFGDLTQSQIDTESKAIPNTAATYDASIDPASCAGGHNETPTLKQRFNNLF
jgi:hypothetical protein